MSDPTVDTGQDTSPESETISGNNGLSRRTFVKLAAVAGVGLTLGVTYRVVRGPGQPATDAAFAPNAFLRIDTDGSITVVVGKSEMGQGVSTSLPMLLAEELEVPLERVAFEFAPAHAAYGVAMGLQVTGGSTSIVESWVPLREAGAAARLMLREAAARTWSIPATDIEMRDAMAHHPNGSTLDYGELAVAAAEVEVPKDIPLKDPADFRLIGTSQMRLDVAVKTTGEAVFGIDAGPSDARIAMVARCPVFGGSLRSFDPAPALAVPGVDEVVELSNGVAVVANGYWPAKQGCDTLVVEWDEGEGSALNDAEITRRFESAIQAGGGLAEQHGDADAALAAASDPIRATYSLPYLAHATMEPMNCTALVEDGRCTIWAPTQWQNGPSLLAGGARQVAGDMSGVGADDTVVHTTFLGGGFGRRAETDYVAEAAELASLIDGAVKVLWSREDDMQHDFYRPASHHEFTASLDDEGMPAAWRHEMASQSIMERLMPGWLPHFVRDRTIMRNGVDPTAVEGASNQPYHVPDFVMSAATVELPIPVGFWRSVGHTHTGFVVESFIDELAHAAGKDPYEYRRDLLGEHPRHLAVLDAVAKAASWGSDLPDGRARGIAVVESFGSYVAEVAEISLEDGRPRVHKVWCAVDCGVIVNPAIVRAQMESGIIYGLTAALYGQISIEGGRAVQSNFDDYRMVRMSEAPEIEVLLVPSGDGPGGIGEPGVPPIAPAVTNALFALEGRRVRDLPIQSA
ncbi:MAG: xanthine dehydrogenase family protein molybdopterin-binding subunit [Gemmatimonadota bacterium]|nr:xanthine dehydrogenase family protein molybdopterin-binding subunit [Gemmatimonadota bacterium]